MSNSNKTYRLNTKVGVDNNSNINLNLNVLQKYDILEVLSLKIGTEGLYRTHTSGYGCIVGRVLANGGVGVPNAKISIFIESKEDITSDDILYNLYPYKTTRDKNDEHIRYNLLPDNKVSECHQIIGTFPNKRLVLDDNNVLEIFEKYYKFTTVTNESGDYMLFGIPTGNQTIHMDLDLSDIGFLSQKPVDMKFKGYNDTFFENAKQFKVDENIDNLVQVVSQSSPVYIKPFWGEEDGEELGITRHDIDVNYKFEPTCVFMGSMVSDNRDNGYSKRCIPSRNMGRMNNLTAGPGTIEMIRKKPDGGVEEFPIMGNRLIDENGVWCYQIPMNLDYIITDEYGNLVPSDNPNKGLPTRTRVRFRLSKSDYESDTSGNHLPKVLIPNNPQNPKKIDYVFGTYTSDYEIDKETNKEVGDSSYRDLFWDNVYTVKSHIPRIQKGDNQRTEKFSGIKNVNVNEGKNPIPYNNMRVNITFMFVLQCAIFKALLRTTYIVNKFRIAISFLLKKKNEKCVTVGDGMCPDLEGWYVAPGCTNNDYFKRTHENLEIDEADDDFSTGSNSLTNDEKKSVCLTNSTDYFEQCVELNLALENNVIQFDFYNDWINGLIYIPRWHANVKRKKSFFFNLIKVRERVQACTEKSFNLRRRYVQQCAMGYSINNKDKTIKVTSTNGCYPLINDLNRCHKNVGRKHVKIFGRKKGGLVHEEKTLKGLNVYYLKPCEAVGDDGKKCNLYATDIVLLGNINKCNIYGIPSELNNMISTTYQLPPSLVQTNMDSDGPLYGGKNGKSRCSSKTRDNIKPIKQTFSNYEKWSVDGEKNDDTSEYAVTEISGIDWGLEGPNQGKNNNGNLYYPGGHFLSISCIISEVNTKSCTNLSRICEYGAMMSQRQSILSNSGDTYTYLIPSGFISKDEIIDNNFRHIFASLNYNKLKTRQNELGLREYDFIPLEPINFNGELKDKVNTSFYNKKIKDNEETPNDANGTDALVRTIEETSKGYVMFRFGLKDNEKLSNKFLGKAKIGDKYYIPSYENSYYFYYGIKNGATALDIFLNDYFAECPTRGESFLPAIKVETKDKIICNEDGGSAVITFENIQFPFIYWVYKDGECLEDLCGKELTDFNTIIIEKLSAGEYEIKAENSALGISLEKSFSINEYLPTSDDYNLYDGSCSVEVINFEEEPITKFNDKKIYFEHETENNGGIITITLPKYNPSKDSPIIYGFAITCNEYCVCYDISQMNDNSNLTFGVLKNKIGDFTQLTFTSVNTVTESELYNFGTGNTLNIYAKDDGMLDISFKAWENDAEYNLYVCYGCGKQLDLMYISSHVVSVNNRRLAYYLYNENVTLTRLRKVLDHTDIECENAIKDGKLTCVNKYEDRRTTIIDYDKLSRLTAYEEWAIKRALYFDESYYNGGVGEIKYGVIGGSTPYKERIIGDSEYIRSDGDLELVKEVDTIDDSIFPISAKEFTIPTKEWIHNDLPDKNPYTILITDKNEAVPYVELPPIF